MTKGPSGRPAIRFRPHHFLCALGYRGEGYSDRFTRNMDRLVRLRLRAPGGDAQDIEVVDTADAICAPCPHRRGRMCESEDRITALDARHAKALGLRPGDRLSWGEAQERIRKRVAPGDLSHVCAGCQWLQYGLCEDALKKLHETSQ